jgi:hypothetical protein
MKTISRACCISPRHAPWQAWPCGSKHPPLNTRKLMRVATNVPPEYSQESLPLWGEPLPAEIDICMPQTAGACSGHANDRLAPGGGIKLAVSMTRRPWQPDGCRQARGVEAIAACPNGTTFTVRGRSRRAGAVLS